MTITLTLPDDLTQELTSLAADSRQPIEELAVTLIGVGLREFGDTEIYVET